MSDDTTQRFDDATDANGYTQRSAFVEELTEEYGVSQTRAEEMLDDLITDGVFRESPDGTAVRPNPVKTIKFVAEGKLDQLATTLRNGGRSER